MPLSTIVNGAVANSQEMESPSDDKVTLDDAVTNRAVKHVTSRKVVGKKTGRKIRLTRVTSSKIPPKDGLPTPDSKKLKRNLATPTPSEGEYNVCSSVPSVASTFSTEG